MTKVLRDEEAEVCACFDQALAEVEISQWLWTGVLTPLMQVKLKSSFDDELIDRTSGIGCHHR